MNKKESIKRQLTGLAFKITKPFCYNCYEEVSKAKTCLKCGSSDLMRLLEGVGVEYGTEWVIEEMLKEHLEPLNQEEVFSNMIEDCYGARHSRLFLSTGVKINLFFNLFLSTDFTEKLQKLKL